MESLFQVMERRLATTPTNIVRSMMQRVNWNERLISLRGSRGVGKTTLLLQYIKLNYPRGSRKVLFCSLDNFYFNRNSLLTLAETFYLEGGRHLFLDEVHKYGSLGEEIKEIYDNYPDMQVVITGSSMLHILKGDADLSRRCLSYYMPGLSLREYLLFYKGLELPAYTLDSIFNEAAAIAEKVCAVCSPVGLLKEYSQFGYYPFFNGNKEDYYMRLENVVNFIIEQELPMLSDLRYGYVRKIRVLLSVLATSKPFEVDISKMSKMLEINRETVLSYLQVLSKADLIYLLYSDLSSVKRMQKPDKIYLSNPNLLYALCLNVTDVGNMRETFVVSQLIPDHRIEYGKEAGDFVIDGKWRLEVGGAKKGFSQIANIENSFVLSDNIEYPSGNKLPLWILGFCR